MADGALRRDLAREIRRVKLSLWSERAASDDDPVASWTGLLTSGSSAARRSRTASTPDGGRLRAEIGSGDIDDLLSAALGGLAFTCEDEVDRKLDLSQQQLNHRYEQLAERFPLKLSWALQGAGFWTWVRGVCLDN